VPVTTAARMLIGALGAVVALSELGSPGAIAAPPPPLPPPPEHPPVDGELEAALAESATGTIPVSVSMALPVEAEAELPPAAVDAQRSTIDQSLESLDTILAGTNSEVLSELDSVPTAVVEVDRAGLDNLLAHPAVESVVLDHELHLLLDSSTVMIDSPRLNRAGIRGGRPGGGRRWRVAIVDTGVSRRHNALSDKIVSEACFSSAGACPNGGTWQLGPGAAAECTFSTLCGHGTHVAGIAAGRAYRRGHRGVAPVARLVMIRVGHRTAGGGWATLSSDLDRGLQRVLDLRRAGQPIAAVNLSIGFGAFTSVPACLAARPSTEQLATQLQAAGVAVVAAAGNGGLFDAVAFPACLPSVYAVSATDDDDVPALFSNVAAMTDWFAPGVRVVAPWRGGPNAERSMNGTSMSSPHVAGAFALLRSCVGNSTPANVAADLRVTGRRVTEAGVTRRRIDVLAAATRNVPNNDFAHPRRIRSTGRVNIRSWNICADREPGEPRSVRNSVWFVWRSARSGRAVISTNPGGGHPTTFDTRLAVFTGRRLDALQRVAHNNNGGAGNRSRVVFRARAGQAYRIRVDGVGAQNGWFNLHLHRGR
jgi:subtilisin family serine protease